MASEIFVNTARRGGCSTYNLRETLKRHAVYKDGESKNYDDSNLLFPPSMIEKHLDEDSIAMILGCGCDICNPSDREPHIVEDLKKEIRGEHGSRLLLAILVWMGAGFAMRSLYFNGLGRDNNFDVWETFANNPDLKATLFGDLLPFNSSGSTPLDIDQILDIFCTRFAEVKQLFKPPYFKEEEIFKNVSPNSNLPFLLETELRSRGQHLSYVKLYKFKIHPEFCSPTLSKIELVRKELTETGIDPDRERDVLEFLRKKRHPNLILLHFAYCHKGISNLVFTHFPMDLRLVLEGLYHPKHPLKAQITPKLRGSILDHWLWVNLKGVVEALLLIHDPDSSIIGAHIDLKPASILVDDSGNFVVTDFGLTWIKDRSTYGMTPLVTDSSLTRIKDKSTYGPSPADSDRKYDIFCLACIMTEIITFVKSRSGALSRFSENLETDDNVDTISQTLWEPEQRRYTVKKRRNDLLEEQEDPRDHYLNEVLRLLRQMLSLETDKMPTMPEVHNALFGQNSDPTLAIQKNPLEAMQVFVHSNKDELHTLCYLYWSNDDDGTVSLRMSYSLGNETMHQTERNFRGSVELVPISIYNHPDTIGDFEETSCSFSGLHRNCVFQFSHIQDFYNFQAAITRQVVLTRSHFKISQCSLTFKRAKWHVHSDTIAFSGFGQIQLWREIRDKEYRRTFVDGVIPVTTEGIIPKEDKFDEDPRRLVIFLAQKLCRYLTIPLSQGKTVLSKNRQKPDTIIIKPGKNRSYFPVGLFGDFKKHSFQISGSSSSDTRLPGIPLDPLVLENREKAHITRLEVSFPTLASCENFLEIYKSEAGLNRSEAAKYLLQRESSNDKEIPRKAPIKKLSLSATVEVSTQRKDQAIKERARVLRTERENLKSPKYLTRAISAETFSTLNTSIETLPSVKQLKIYDRSTDRKKLRSKHIKSSTDVDEAEVLLEDEAAKKMYRREQRLIKEPVGTLTSEDNSTIALERQLEGAKELAKGLLVDSEEFKSLERPTVGTRINNRPDLPSEEAEELDHQELSTNKKFLELEHIKRPTVADDMDFQFRRKYQQKPSNNKQTLAIKDSKPMERSNHTAVVLNSQGKLDTGFSQQALSETKRIPHKTVMSVNNLVQSSQKSSELEVPGYSVQLNGVEQTRQKYRSLSPPNSLSEEADELDHQELSTNNKLLELARIERPTVANNLDFLFRIKANKRKSLQKPSNNEQTLSIKHSKTTERSNHMAVVLDNQGEHDTADSQQAVSETNRNPLERVMSVNNLVQSFQKRGELEAPEYPVQLHGVEQILEKGYSLSRERLFSIWSIASRLFIKVLIEFGVLDEPVQTGKKRVYWTCRCGYRSFDDFIELHAGAVDAYAAYLRERAGIRKQSQPASEQTGLFESLRNLSSSISFFGKQSENHNCLPQYQTARGLPNNQTPNFMSSADTLFLLLCIPYKQYATKLVHVDLREVMSDQQFFCTLKSNYSSMRGAARSMLSLKTLKRVKFVQFEMYKSELVDIRKVDDIPPEARRDEYQYRPMPAKFIPPVGENHMMHYCTHPEHADETKAICLDRIPKKLKERLLVCPSEGTRVGWGVHFVEGWHLTLFSLLGFITLLVSSLVFMICWAVLKHDLQSASGVAAYMVGFMALCVGTVQAALELN